MIIKNLSQDLFSVLNNLSVSLLSEDRLSSQTFSVYLFEFEIYVCLFWTGKQDRLLKIENRSCDRFSDRPRHPVLF